jgi:serine/threonine protein kinase
LLHCWLKLHDIGVLHCDKKQSNILWDDKTKVVRLVDFGLAQREENAQSYHATRKSEAPEIGENHPLSRMSDAYAVGKTIEEVIEKTFDVPDVKEVFNVAKLLQCPVVSNRLSLKKAKSMLVALLKVYRAHGRIKCQSI